MDGTVPFIGSRGQRSTGGALMLADRPEDLPLDLHRPEERSPVLSQAGGNPSALSQAGEASSAHMLCSYQKKKRKRKRKEEKGRNKCWKEKRQEGGR